MVRVKNFVPAISVEGFEDATDARRGDGTYAKVERAMDLLREHGLPFGVSCCFTSAERRLHRERGVLRLDGRTRACCSAGSSRTSPWGVDAPKELMADGRAARAPLPLRPRDAPVTKPLFTLGLPERRRVRGRLHRRRPPLPAHQRRRRRGPVRVRPLQQREHPRGVAARGAAERPSSWSTTDGQPFNANHLRPVPGARESQGAGRQRWWPSTGARCDRPRGAGVPRGAPREDCAGGGRLGPGRGAPVGRPQRPRPRAGGAGARVRPRRTSRGSPAWDATWSTREGGSARRESLRRQRRLNRALTSAWERSQPFDAPLPASSPDALAGRPVTGADSTPRGTLVHPLPKGAPHVV